MKYVLIALVCLFGPPALAQQPNHLLGEASPYLQQHIHNPVDWYPWGDEALEKARQENKMIFVSVGYAACHWCHVMRRESFENAAIAKILNDNYVSIKIDREVRPDLDEQFQLVTEFLAKSGGWPNSVFLSANGDPVFAGTYFPPVAFTEVITQIASLWTEDPGAVSKVGSDFSALFQDYLNSTVAAADLTPEAIYAAAKTIALEVDEFNGGLGVAPKFPEEPLFLFLLDQAERTGDADLLMAVTSTLDGMIKGGIHDHVGGGFHRYAIDPEWQIPHFEKMLYTQALTGRLLVRAWRATREPRYRRAALRTIEFVLRDLTADNGAFYAALDADSETPAGTSEEGAFYIWTAADFQALTGAKADLLSKVYNVTDPGSFEDSNILHTVEFAAETAAQLGIDEAEYYAETDQVLSDLREARARRSPPFRDEKIVVSWNAAMIETLAEASYIFDKPALYHAASRAARYILTEMFNDGDLSRVSFEGTIGVPAQLSDYAALGLAMLALHDFGKTETDRQFWLEQASTLNAQIPNRFAKGDGAFVMSQRHDGLGVIRPVDDTELPSGNGLALALMSGLAKRMEAPHLIRQATVLAASLSGQALEIPDQRAFVLKAAQTLDRGESGAIRFIGGGAVKIEAAFIPGDDQFRVVLTVKDGWHINAHKPLEDFYIPTELRLAGVPVAAASYPQPLVKSLSFNAKPLALYEGSIVLNAEIPDGKAGPLSAVLSLQTCSDQICLTPEELRFTIW